MYITLSIIRPRKTKRKLKLKGPYYENSTFLVLLHVNLGIWHVYQPKTAGKKPLATFVMVPLGQKRHDLVYE